MRVDSKFIIVKAPSGLSVQYRLLLIYKYIPLPCVPLVDKSHKIFDIKFVILLSGLFGKVKRKTKRHYGLEFPPNQRDHSGGCDKIQSAKH